MKFKRILSSVLCLLLCSVLLLVGVGCNEQRAAESAFAIPEELNHLETTCVAENSRYSLIWNAEKECVILFDKVMETEWSYIPEDALNNKYDYSEEGGSDKADVRPQVKSPIIVHYFATSNFLEEETNAFAMSIDKGNYSLTRTKDGIEMLCYFEDRQLAIPVCFTLTDKGVDVSIDPTKVQENEDYNVFGVTVAPFFCSVSNANANKDGYYLFTPSGSGALVTPQIDNTKEAAVEITETVYGQDANVTKFDEVTETETVRLPVYGAVNNDKAVCAIIKDGAESAHINTVIAQKFTGYSYISTEFHIRGYQEVIQSLFTATTVKTKLYADAFTTDKMCIGFYPLYGEDASYVGIANTYRNYLNETGALKAEKSKDSMLNLKLVGGIETKEFHFGIPSDAMLTATTLSQAYDIVSGVKDLTKLDNINVNLIGFGSSGNDIGVVAGNYEINSAFGKEADLKKLVDYTKANNVNLYMNFDMVRFSASGGGVSTGFGKADAANGSFTELNYFSPNLRNKNSSLRTYYLVSRSKLSEVATNIKEISDEWQLPGVSLDTLTSISYSDYCDRKYYSRADFGDQATAIINTYKTNGYNVAGSDANAFAAAACTHVYDVPTQSSKYRSFTVDVPFYQIVFKGSVSLSGSSINLATDEQITLLKAVESGIGLTYTLIGDHDTNLITSAQNVFYGSVYWDETIERGARDDIQARLVDDAKFSNYFNSVNGAKIVDHKVITEHVRMTTFDNGVSVYVNFGRTDYTDGDITVAARDYTVKGA